MDTILIAGFGGYERDFAVYKNTFENLRITNFDNSITLEDHLARIHEDVGRSSANKVNLIGISWGGILALKYAEQYPHKINALVVCGSARSLKMAASLNFLMKKNLIIFRILVGLFILSYPFMRIFDANYRQKYGGIGLLNRLGWKNAHKIYNETLLTTKFNGTIEHPSLLLNIEQDMLVDKEELQELIDSSKSINASVTLKYLKPQSEDNIHFTHELDTLIVMEAKEFLAQQGVSR